MKRLEKLKGYILILKKLKKTPRSQFIEDPFIHGLAERYLHLSIEALIDIGNHVISDQKFKKPETYAEIFEILFKNGIIPKTLYLKISDMPAFRNVLVHDYLDIDHGIVYKTLQEKLELLEQLAKKFAKFIQ